MLRLARRLSSRVPDGVVAVDRRGLGRLGYSALTSELERIKVAETALGKELVSMIKARGPITVHEFMRQCLLHPKYGYYARPGAERNFGLEGDFITAPELSQLFGELIGVWLVNQWHELGKPGALRVVEIGPGRGTLMADVLRATRAWPNFVGAIQVHLVEASPSLQPVQQRVLGAVRDDDGWRDATGTRLHWHDSLPGLDDLDDVPTLFVGQEVLDAMPAHQFVLTSGGWREKLVDVDDTPDSTLHFRYVVAPTPTPASRALVLSSYLNDADPALFQREDHKTIEVSPSALATVDDVARRVAKTTGAALFIDYGKNTCLGDTLRAFKRHVQVHVLSQPGLSDLTVDTDFAASVRQAALVPDTAVFGPVDQGEFLGRMGIAERLGALANVHDITDKQVDHLISASERLVDPAQMGQRYKVIAIVDRACGPPAGFRLEERVDPPPDPLSVIKP